jgi:hypothetical protein
MKFIKTHGLKILLGIVAFYLLYLGYSITRDMLFGKALAIASAQYDARIAELQVKIDAQEAAYNSLSELSARDRELYRANAEREKRKQDAVFAVFKSETAAELKKRKATIEQVLVEKERDEIALVEANETIDALYQDNISQGIAWALSDKNKDAAHAKIVADLEMKYATCAAWSTKLEGKLKPKLFTNVIQGVVIAGAFALGKAL